MIPEFQTFWRVEVLLYLWIPESHGDYTCICTVFMFINLEKIKGITIPEMYIYIHIYVSVFRKKQHMLVLKRQRMYRGCVSPNSKADDLVARSKGWWRGVFFGGIFGIRDSQKKQPAKYWHLSNSTTFAQMLFFQKAVLCGLPYCMFFLFFWVLFFEISSPNVLFLEIWKLNHSIPQNKETKKTKDPQECLGPDFHQRLFSFGLPRVFWFWDSDNFIGY